MGYVQGSIASGASMEGRSGGSQQGECVRSQMRMNVRPEQCVEKRANEGLEAGGTPLVLNFREMQREGERPEPW